MSSLRTSSPQPYVDLASSMRKLDQRDTRYRFDLDALDWAGGAMRGLHLPPRLLASMGIDPDVLAAHPEAQAMFQWAAGLEICRSFSTLEQHLVDFVDAEKATLGPTRSAQMLYEEEQKHVALFKRYADLLTDAHPEWVEPFQRAFAPCMSALLLPYTRDEYPDPAIQHYFFWIKTLFFEEYTLFLHEKLKGEHDVVCSLWLEAHRCHRLEETQHVVTDLAHVEALELSEINRRACATTFWAHLEQTFDLFLGVSASRRMVCAAFPELAAKLPDQPTRDLPIFREVLSHRLFRGTRRCAPSSLFEIASGEVASQPGDADALLKGPLLVVPGGNVVDALDAACLGGRGLVWVSESEDDRTESYAELRTRALHALDALTSAGVGRGEPVVLRLELPEHVLPLLWACLLGGRIPVLLAPPSGRDDDTERRARRVLEMLGHATVVSADGRLGLDPVEVLAHRAETLPAPEPSGPHDVAVIQFSSGSTGQPKGVQLTHQNILANTNAMISHLGARPDDVFLSWLPLHHDMALIGYHFLPLVLGTTQVFMHPLQFLKRPGTWLQAISRHRASVSATPTFGLTTTTERARMLEGVDLSSLRTLLLGAEPISLAANQAFAERFAEHGLRPEALTPGYGLAESTLCVTGRRYGAPTHVRPLDRDALLVGMRVRPMQGGLSIVSCGPALPGAELRIVDEQGRQLREEEVGHIETRGPCVTPGFYGEDLRPEQSFRGDWLRTGDLGFVAGGELYVTGRAKDVLYVSGTKRYAHDIEESLHSVDGLHPRHIVAFGTYDHAAAVDRLCVAATIRARGRTVAEVAEDICAQVATHAGHRPDVVIDIPASEIPRTTSGKLQRDYLRQRYERGELAEYLVSGQATQDEDPLTARVRAAWGEALGQPIDRVPIDVDFRVLGGTSIQAAVVHALLEDVLKRPIAHEVLLQAATVRDMAAALRDSAPKRSVPVPVAEPKVSSGDIAVIGMGLRLPGADTPEEFWELLRSGGDRFGAVPTDRWNHRRQLERDPTLCPTGAFLDEPFAFAPEAFGLDPEQGAAMEPRQRLFLEAAERALRDAGVFGGDVATFVSTGENPLHARSFLDDLARGEADMTGRLENATNNIVAARVAKAFGLTGAAVVVQAACASSLVAIHQARRALQLSECSVALAGGVEFAHSPTIYSLFGPNRVLSRQGRCLPFSAEADGFVPGEGASAVILKPLEFARRDGDRVLAVIRGSAVTNDGTSFSGVAPNPAGQIRAARLALAEAGIPSSEVGMIEAHGTATAIGDAVELMALRTVYPESQAAVTSVKSNLGHLLAAAGATSFVKTVLALQHGMVPPIAGLRQVDPRHGDLADGPCPVGRPTPLTTGLAAINALGIGGTNCHMILQAAPEVDASPRGFGVVSIGARTDAGLAREAALLAEYVEKGSPAEYTAALARRAAPYTRRRATVVQRGESVRAVLAGLADAPALPRVGKVAVVFPGPGSLVEGSGAGLRGDRRFDEAWQSCAARIEAAMGESMEALIGAASSRIDAAQPAVFAVSWATWTWLRSLGLEPDAVIGHSAGEYAALAAAEVWSPEDALSALIARGDAMAAAPEGRMLAVLCGEAQARRIAPDLELAVHNAPEQVVLSGSHDAVARAERAFAECNVQTRVLPIPCAAHSTAMESAQPRLSQALSGQTFQSPSLRVFSTRTGESLSSVSADYLVGQLRDSVRFREAVEAALASDVRTFVEVGASAVLSPAIQAIAAARGIEVNTVGVHRSSLGEEGALQAVATLFSLGLPVRLASLGAGNLGLPSPAYDRKQLPIELPEAQAARAGVTRPENGDIDDTERALFGDHRARGRAIAPAAWMLEKLFSVHGAGSLEGLAITAPVTSESQRWRVVEDQGVRFCTQEGEEWVTHLSGRFSQSVPASEFRFEESSGDLIDVESVYVALAEGGLTYGPTLRSVESMRKEGDTLWVSLRPTAPLAVRWIDPSVLDGAFQALVCYLMEGVDRRPMLGFAARAVRVHRPLVGPCRARISLKHQDSEGLRVDIVFADVLGRVALELEDFAARRMASTTPQVLALGWSEGESEGESARPAGPVAILGEQTEGLALSTDLLLGGSVAIGPVPSSVDAARAALRHARAALLLAPDLSLLHACASELSTLEHLVIRTKSLAVATMARAFGAEVGVKTQVWLGDAVEPEALWRLVGSGLGIARPGMETLELAAVDPGEFMPSGPVWVLGGTGGIGHALALELAHRYGVPLAISGRRDQLPDAQRNQLQATGVEFTYVPVDLGCAQDVGRALAKVEASIGPIRGVVHAAGLLDDGPLAAQSWQQCQAVLAPKQLGAAHLREVFEGRGLDWVAFVSSLSAALPSPGQAAYGAANASLDEAVERMPARHAVSVLFGPWAEVGMVASDAHRERLMRVGLPPMATAEAVEAFLAALSSGSSRVVVATLPSGGRQRLERALRSAGGRPRAPEPQRTPVPSAPVAPVAPDAALAASDLDELDLVREAVGHRLHSAWDPEATFAELGLDSLGGVEVVRALERRLGRPLHPTLLFEHPTPRQLAEVLARPEAT